MISDKINGDNLYGLLLTDRSFLCNVSGENFKRFFRRPYDTTRGISQEPADKSRLSSFNPVYREMSNDCDTDIFFGDTNKNLMGNKLGYSEGSIHQKLNDRPHFRDIQ